MLSALFSQKRRPSPWYTLMRPCISPWPMTMATSGRPSPSMSPTTGREVENSPVTAHFTTGSKPPME